MGVIEIIATLLKAAGLAAKVKEKKILPTPPDDLKDKHRWYQCTIINATQFRLLPEENYFNSGSYWVAPGAAVPLDQMKFSGCNKDHPLFTGVSGGLSYKVYLDDEHSFHFAIGLTSPVAGGYKAGVVESSVAKDGYEAATDTGNSITSENKYKSKDKDGNEQEIEFHFAAIPGVEMKVVIAQFII
ncbi:hypothetical protein EDB81DRAFT_917934 [Dactylonectria macrodidyma]|uniref:Uncharacterized protein n=1 Tax=Dactylonectria macrodidyma TaxID=307937 RepID=A0A9P9JFA5_9HYPO|nr:hypothetical protein EDB81DRAFT_917934 [Dactylonectria macrodidyma]